MSNSLLANNLPASPELGFKNHVSYDCIAIFIITRAATCGDGYDGGNDFNDIKWVHTALVDGGQLVQLIPRGFIHQL